MTAGNSLNLQQNDIATASKHIANLEGLRVTMCCEPDASNSNWIRLLQRERIEVTSIWPLPRERLDADMDVLICEYFPQMADFIPWIPGDPKAALIVILPMNGHYDEGLILATAAQCVLQKPFSEVLFKTSVKVAWSQFRYERRLKDRIGKLDENVKTLRTVERAKLILMIEKNIDEAAAYRHLRNTAMKRQISVSSLALGIVETSQLGTNQSEIESKDSHNAL